MLSWITKKLFGDPRETRLKDFYPFVEKINALEADITPLSDDELVAKTEQFKSRIGNGEKLDNLLPEAFAVVREAAKRVLGMRHFDVQLIGGIVLHQGRIAEMKTGEGKTLVSTLPAYLNALEGKGVYVVTVNDYLAKRDSEWMGKIFTFLGLSVGLIQSGMAPDERLEAYKADITYGTNNEFGFDYLRDNLSHDPAHCSQVRRHYAIIDEVDSILIDEARTPLIISGPLSDSADKYKKIVKVARSLKKDTDFTLEEKHRNVVLTDSGNEKIEEALGIDTIYSIENMAIAHMSIQCLRALHLYQRDVDYVVKDGEVLIVDEFTGRLMEGRRYSDGLHQAIEAAENLKIRSESQTLASITFQNYFRLFPKLSGMTGTAVTEEAEFGSIYGLEVVVIPTNRPMVREDAADVVYKSCKEKYKAIISDITEAHKAGQPVLVGTISIAVSELLSSMLQKEKLPHHVLNAKYHAQEAEIIAKAGEKGAITIATNMAGRGTDIKLGEGVSEVGGLYVIGSERHESRRIDNQLRGRSGRQGDTGKSKFFVALDDELMRLFGSDRIARVMERLGLPDDTPIEHGMISKSIERAQKKVEKYHFGIRKQILQYDDVLNKQRESIYGMRRRILFGEGLAERIQGMIGDFSNRLVLSYFGEKGMPPRETLPAEMIEQITVVFPEVDLSGIQGQEALEKRLYDRYLKQASQLEGDMFQQVIVRQILLNTLDRKWVDHLNNMDVLREGIGLRGYGQRDPLVEYKIEGFDMYQELLAGIAEESLSIINRAVVVEKETQQEMVGKPISDSMVEGRSQGKSSSAASQESQTLNRRQRRMKKKRD